MLAISYPQDHAIDMWPFVAGVFHSVRVVKAPPCSRGLGLFVAEDYSVTWLDHLSFIHSSPLDVGVTPAPGLS